MKTISGLGLAFKIIGAVVLGCCGLLAVVMAAIVLLPHGRSVASAPTSPPLIVLVHKGLRGLRITNETDATWDRCTASVIGDYETPFQTLHARESVEVYYTSFQANGTPLVVDDGYARAIRHTAISCTGADARRYDAILR